MSNTLLLGKTVVVDGSCRSAYERLEGMLDPANATRNGFGDMESTHHFNGSTIDNIFITDVREDHWIRITDENQDRLEKNRATILQHMTYEYREYRE